MPEAVPSLTFPPPRTSKFPIVPLATVRIQINTVTHPCMRHIISMSAPKTVVLKTGLTRVTHETERPAFVFRTTRSEKTQLVKGPIDEGHSRAETTNQWVPFIPGPSSSLPEQGLLSWEPSSSSACRAKNISHTHVLLFLKCYINATVITKTHSFKSSTELMATFDQYVFLSPPRETSPTTLVQTPSWVNFLTLKRGS